MKGRPRASSWKPGFWPRKTREVSPVEERMGTVGMPTWRATAWRGQRLHEECRGNWTSSNVGPLLSGLDALGDAGVLVEGHEVHTRHCP